MTTSLLSCLRPISQRVKQTVKHQHQHKAAFHSKRTEVTFMICCSCGVFSTYCFWSAILATQFGIKMAADVGSDPMWSRERGWGKFQFQSIQPPTSKTIEYQKIHKINFGEALLRGGSFWVCIRSHIHNIHTFHKWILFRRTRSHMYGSTTKPYCMSELKRIA